MKTILIILAAFIVLAVTNPDTQQHKEVVKQEFTESYNKGSEAESAFGEMLNSKFAETYAETLTSRFIGSENYVFFSITTVNNKKGQHVVGIGILGQVFLNNNFKQKIKELK